MTDVDSHDRYYQGLFTISHSVPLNDNTIYLKLKMYIFILSLMYLV